MATKLFLVFTLIATGVLIQHTHCQHGTSLSKGIKNVIERCETYFTFLSNFHCVLFLQMTTQISWRLLCHLKFLCQKNAQYEALTPGRTTKVNAQEDHVEPLMVCVQSHCSVVMKLDKCQRLTSHVLNLRTICKAV